MATIEEQVKAKMRLFLEGHQLGSDPLTSKYSEQMRTTVPIINRRESIFPFGIGSKGNCLEFVFLIYSKKNSLANSFQSTYNIIYEFLSDTIQLVSDNGREVTAPEERENIFQLMIDQLTRKMPTASGIREAKESQVKDKITKRNIRVVKVGLALAVLTSVLGVIFMGPLGLIGAAIVVLGTAVLGKHTGLFDTQVQRADRVQAVFKQEKTNETGSALPVSPPTSLTQVSSPEKPIEPSSSSMPDPKKVSSAPRFKR